jgi:hypothetical protein
VQRRVDRRYFATPDPLRTAGRIVASPEISHKKCIEAANQRKLFCNNDFCLIRERPDAHRV